MPDPYVQREEVDALIPPAVVIKALDDDNDGEEDEGVWDKLATTIQNVIDGYLAPRFSLPLATVPKLVKSCALTLANEAIYDRSGFSGEKNPWAGRSKAVHELLKSIMTSDIGLGPDYEPANETPGIVTEPSKMYREGRMMI